MPKQKKRRAPNLYALLKVDATASSAQIRKAYHALARKVHPDKCRDDPAAAENFRTLQSAYEILSDDARRARYDKTGRVPRELGGDDDDAADDLFWQAYERCEPRTRARGAPLAALGARATRLLTTTNESHGAGIREWGQTPIVGRGGAGLVGCMFGRAI